MRRADAIALLNEHAAELRSAGVKHVSLFGSVARDEAGNESDVDLVVETIKPLTLFTIGPLSDLFAALLGRPVDLIDKTGFDRAKRLQRETRGDLIHVF
jgi:predicted nucleotidyltransferase